MSRFVRNFTIASCQPRFGDYKPFCKTFVLTVSSLYFICGSFVLSFVLLMSCVCHASRLFIAALWSPAWKGLTSWLLLVMFNCVFVTFPCRFLGQDWYLIVSIPDRSRLSYLASQPERSKPI